MRKGLIQLQDGSFTNVEELAAIQSPAADDKPDRLRIRPVGLPGSFELSGADKTTIEDWISTMNPTDFVELQDGTRLNLGRAAAIRPISMATGYEEITVRMLGEAGALTYSGADAVTIYDWLSAGQVLFTNTVVVAKSNNAYTTIQSAIDSIADAAADNRYTVLVMPGVYEETVTGKDYVDVIGVTVEGQGVVLTNEVGPLYAFPSSGGSLKDIYLQLLPVSDTVTYWAVEASGGDVTIKDCRFLVASAVDGCVAGLVKATSCSYFRMEHCWGEYTMTGNGAPGEIHIAVNLVSQTYARLENNRVDMRVSDQADSIIGIWDSATYNTELFRNTFAILSDHTSFNGNCVCYYYDGEAGDSIASVWNAWSITAGQAGEAGTYHCFYINQQATLLSVQDTYQIALGGSGTPYWVFLNNASASASIILVSAIGSGTYGGTGTYFYSTSSPAGDFLANGVHSIGAFKTGPVASPSSGWTGTVTFASDTDITVVNGIITAKNP